MTLADLTTIIMPRIAEFLAKTQAEDKLICISTDEAFDNGILLTFARYSGCDYDEKDTYDMRAIIGKNRIIYENAINRVDVRDYIEDGIDNISVAEYDNIMNLEGKND